jgi:hypothetical protein
MEELKSAKVDDFVKIQGRIEGLEWFINEINNFEKKILKTNK